MEFDVDPHKGVTGLVLKEVFYDNKPTHAFPVSFLILVCEHSLLLMTQFFCSCQHPFFLL